jgi:ABC-type uncharacterized transport system ATPase subunit
VDAPAAVTLCAPSLSTAGTTTILGALVALHESADMRAGSVHARLGENGTRSFALVACIMGFAHADRRALSPDGRARCRP